MTGPSIRPKRPSEIAAWHQIDGWLALAEADRLAELAASVRPDGQIVEVGTYRGRATAALALGALAAGAHVLSIDHYQGVAGVAADWSSSVERVRDSILGVLAGSQLVSVGDASVQLMVGESTSVAEQLHDEQSVAADLAAWYPLIVPGGLLAMHDYCRGHGDGVIAAVAPYLADGRLRMVGHVGLIAELRKAA